MELQINRQGMIGATNTTATMTHNNQSIEWDVSIIEKTSFTGEFDIFEEINGYWANQPKIKQDKIFDTYLRIKDSFGSIWEQEALTLTLYDLVAELLSHHDLNDILHYVGFYSRIRIPDDLKDSFIASIETSRTRERTYLREDYRQLVGMTLALRAMVPVWGEFISRTEEETGTTYKEYYAAKLLTKSNLVHTEAWEKLRVFVEHSLPTDKSNSAAILGGVSSEDFPSWVLGLVIVRRLSIGDLRGVEPGSSLVSFIHKYMGGRVKGHDANFIGMVKEKTIEDQGQESESNLSKLEGYKVKQEIPAGDIAIPAHYIADVNRMALRVAPDIDLALVALSMDSVKALESQQIWKPQVTLTQWVLARVAPPRGMLQQEKITILQAIAVTQALLWHRGHRELAGLVSAMAMPTKAAMSLTGSSQRHRIPKELVEEPNALYPFSRRSGKQQQLRPGKQQNSTAVTNVELVEKMFSEHDWRLTLPPAWVVELTGTNDQRYPVPADIKIKLAQLALAIAKRTF